MSSFIAPKVNRGRITNYRTGLSLYFCYNPGRVQQKKGVNLSVDSLPGQSDALVRFASGKANTIDFTLNIDGEGRLRRSGAQLFNGAVAEFPLSEAGSSYSIAGELEFLESFQYPADPELSPTQLAEPDKIVFTFGRRYQGVLCVMSDWDEDIFELDPELSPTKAQVKVQLTRVVTVQRYAHTIWDVPAGIGMSQQFQRGAQVFRPGGGSAG